MADVCGHEQLGDEQSHSSKQREQRREQLAWIGFGLGFGLG